MKSVEVAIFDLDNTLYDWYAAFIPAFYAMVEVATDLLRCDRETLLDELRSVHVKHHDVEHPFSLLETPLVRQFSALRGHEEARAALDPAFHAFNKVRKRELSLFPGTLDTLQELTRRGIKLVAFTDSKYFAAIGRIERLGLTGLFHRIYCRARGFSEGARRPSDELADIHHSITQLPPDESKPNPQVLVDIAALEGSPMSKVAYVGDSIAKDILMAKRAGCFAIWAKYGAAADREMYDRLVRISHWTPEDIRREADYAKQARAIAADFVCEKSISELLSVLTGVENVAARRA